jgi:uncharacterized protein YndB with AHSA1/START domain
MVLTCIFDASPDKVWDAWTKREILDKWWAPKPWKAETKNMDFKDGGRWLYAMVGPNNERHWARADFSNIQAGKSFEVQDAFTDENGTVDKNMPGMHWKNSFEPSGSGTKVTMEITADKEEDLKKILEMGFEEGISMGMTNLDELLAEQK